MENMEILLVEDNAGDAVLIRQILADTAVPVNLHIVRDGEQALTILSDAHFRPELIILDLNNSSVQPLELIAKLKSDDDLRHISLIGYLSHVQGELKQKAQEAGANIVMARSAFSQNLPQILKRHAGVR